MKYFNEYEFLNQQFRIEVSQINTELDLILPIDIVYEIVTCTQNRQTIKTSTVSGYQLEEEIQNHIHYAEVYINRSCSKNYNEKLLMNLGFKVKEQ